jgi:diguanylate cyclase (GGDEF)-like protein/PAS domain S-box-containing protein
MAILSRLNTGHPILVDGMVVGAIVTFNDIRERKQIEEALRASEVRFKLIFNAAPLGIALIDSLTGHIYSVNPMFAKIAGRSMEEMAHIDWMSITHPDDVQKDLDNMALLNAGKISGFQMEKRYLHHDGTPIWINMTIAPIYVEDKAHPRHLCMIEDITERKQMEDQVRQLAFHDPLTKLPNRRLVTDRLIQSMAASKRSGCYGALMFLDLDNFKPINDTHGHAAGDLLLIEVADRLKCCVREMDTVGRIGGDEFVVMLINLNEDRAEATSQAEIVAEKIHIRLSEPYLLTIKREGKADTIIEHHCTASIGVALFSKYEDSQDDILKWADTAMYQAKDAGRNLIRFYDSEA